MLKLVSAGLVACWALCIFLNSFPAEQASKGRNTRPPSPAPKGYELRKVRRFGRKVVAIRLQVLVA